MNTLYNQVGLRVVLLDIIPFIEEDEFDLKPQDSGAILDNFKRWIKEQRNGASDNSMLRKKWRR